LLNRIRMTNVKLRRLEFAEFKRDIESRSAEKRAWKILFSSSARELQMTQILRCKRKWVRHRARATLSNIAKWPSTPFRLRDAEKNHQRDDWDGDRDQYQSDYVVHGSPRLGRIKAQLQCQSERSKKSIAYLQTSAIWHMPDRDKPARTVIADSMISAASRCKTVRGSNINLTVEPTNSPLVFA